MPERENGARLLTVTFREKLVKEVEFMLPARKKIDGPVATVTLSRGLTINMGNYESARVDETITLPCNADPAEIEATRQSLRNEIEGHVEAERVRLKGTMAERIAAVKQGFLKIEDFDLPIQTALKQAL